MDTVRRLLGERQQELAYVQVLPDEPDLLRLQIAWAIARPEPFVCCGGIGGTPDDHTRQCVAAATEVPLVAHPEGVAILHRRFGPDANRGRMCMVDFPEGADLIPNPVNEIPGFSFRSGHFVPGFPNMAEPMIAWVLDVYYATGAETVAHSLHLPSGREGDLHDLMEDFVAAHPEVGFSSLPRYAEGVPSIVLGVKGEAVPAAAALADLKRRLDDRSVVYEV